MPTISRTDSVAANTRSGNVLAGEAFEFLSVPTLISLLCSGSAAGLVVDFTVGNEAILAGAVIPATNRFPIRPDDAVVQHGGLPAERLFLTYLNTTAGVLTVNTLLDLQT